MTTWCDRGAKIQVTRWEELQRNGNTAMTRPPVQGKARRIDIIPTGREDDDQVRTVAEPRQSCWKEPSQKWHTPASKAARTPINVNLVKDLNGIHQIQHTVQ